MDCLAILCDDGELSTETLNEFLEEYRIGYRACGGGWNHGVSWEKIEDVEDEDESLENDTGDVFDDAVSDNSVLQKPDAKSFSRVKMKTTRKESKDKMQLKDRPTKIFITHSSVDKDYVLLLTELLRNLKVPNDAIICTSDHRHKIPNGKNTYAWLREQFIDSDLHMIFVLSEHYYSSNPCLNEMGAAWLAAKKSDLLLLPGFGFKDLRRKMAALIKMLKVAV